MIQNPYVGLDHHQKLISSFDCSPNHNTKFQRNRLITYSVILLTDRMTEKHHRSHNLLGRGKVLIITIMNTILWFFRLMSWRLSVPYRETFGTAGNRLPFSCTTKSVEAVKEEAAHKTLTKSGSRQRCPTCRANSVCKRTA